MDPSRASIKCPKFLMNWLDWAVNKVVYTFNAGNAGLYPRTVR